MDREALEALFLKHECSDFKWIRPEDIVVSRWVRFKCLFGCKEYGKAAVCPPNLPSVEECRAYFAEFTEAVLFHFSGVVEKPEQRHAWTKTINENLLSLERDVFLSGYHKAMVLYIDPCNICGECVPEKEDCRSLAEARPALEGLAVDVFSTVRSQGYEINVLTGYDQMMNRFGMLLIE